MRYLLISLFLMGCTFPPPAGRAPPAPEPTQVPEVVTWPIKVEPAPKTKKPVHVPPAPAPVPEPEKPQAPCDVNQDGGRQQVLETLKCLEDKP